MLRSDLDSLTPSRAFTRRGFVQTAVGSGFAAAVLPVGAQTITTDTAGLTAGEIKIPVGGSSIPGYRAAPAGKTGLPVILVVSEVFGVHEHIADVTRRFAKLGYLAIAPEPFVRQGDAKSYSEIARLMSEVISKVPDEQVLGDFDATVAWAKANGGNPDKIAMTGFCWGGRIAWLYAAHNPDVKAAVSWYGRLVGASTPLTPKHPIDVVGKLSGPVLGLYGADDPGTPLDTIDKMKAALASGSAAAKKSEFVVYPDTPHAFHADYRPSYRKVAAQDGWKRAVAWFKANGVA